MLDATGKNWSAVFLLAAVISSVGASFYIVFIRTDEIDFDHREANCCGCVIRQGHETEEKEKEGEVL